MTIEEIKEQFQHNKHQAEQYFAEEAPEIQQRVAQFTPPLLSNEVKIIISALWHNQITAAHLQKDTLEFLVATDAYKSYLRRKKG